MNVSGYLVLWAACCVALAATGQAGEPGAKEGGMGVKVEERGEVVRVEVDGQLFTEYHYKPQEADRPFFYPVIGPTGENVTRHWPIQEDNKDDERDHKHHRSLWYTHGAVNGLDFWGEGRGPKILHDRFVKVASGADAGVIESEDKWVTPDGKLVCTDTRRHVFYKRPEGRMLDFEITFHAGQEKLVLGDTKEGSMAIRVAPTLNVKGKVGQGHILTSEGDRDAKAWGKRARWCDYYGPLGGKTVGIAIFDHPQNPRHPTTWHVRDYGLFAANPFGIHDFEGKPKAAGDLTVPAGQSVTFRYRFYFHAGEPKEARVEELYREYAGAQSKEDKGGKAP